MAKSAQASWLALEVAKHTDHDLYLTLASGPRLHDDPFARIGCRTCKSIVAESDDEE